MIALTEKDVGEFRELFKRETGKDITDDQARAYALNVLHLVALVVQPETLPSDLA